MRRGTDAGADVDRKLGHGRHHRGGRSGARKPIAAARQVVRSLLNSRLVEEVLARVDDAGYARRTSEDGEVLMLRATALGLSRVGEGETGTPTPEPIAAETWETTRDAGAAVVAPAPLVTDLAAYGCQQVQDGPEGANGGQDTVKAVQGHGEIAQAAVEPPGAVPELAAESGRGLRHSRLQQAAQALLDAWDARAANDDDIADKLSGSCRRSSLRAGGERFGGRRDRSVASPEGHKAGAGPRHATP